MGGSTWKRAPHLGKPIWWWYNQGCDPKPLSAIHSVRTRNKHGHAETLLTKGGNTRLCFRWNRHLCEYEAGKKKKPATGFMVKSPPVSMTQVSILQTHMCTWSTSGKQSSYPFRALVSHTRGFQHPLPSLVSSKHYSCKKLRRLEFDSVAKEDRCKSSQRPKVSEVW